MVNETARRAAPRSAAWKRVALICTEMSRCLVDDDELSCMQCTSEVDRIHPRSIRTSRMDDMTPCERIPIVRIQVAAGDIEGMTGVLTVGYRDTHKEISRMKISMSSITCFLIGLCAAIWVTACVAAQDPPSSFQRTQADEAQVDTQADTKMEVPSSVDELFAASPNSCLSISEPCKSGCTLCSVRCCDGLLVNFVNERCGSCGGDANAACAAHGGPLHIRWCP